MVAIYDSSAISLPGDKLADSECGLRAHLKFSIFKKNYCSHSDLSVCGGAHRPPALWVIRAAQSLIQFGREIEL